MSYFAAVLARAEEEWVAAEVDLDEVETLDDVGEQVRKTLAEEAPDADDELMLVLVDHGDEWFGIVRLELDEDPRVFVSDEAAALRHALGETLLPDLVAPPVDLDEVDATDIEVDEGDADEEDEELVPDDEAVRLLAEPPVALPLHHPGPAGDAALLGDLGVSRPALEALARAGAPSEALDRLVAALGAAGALEEVR